MPNSLRCRLNKLVYKGELKEKDLTRIVIIPEGATNGDIIQMMFPDAEYLGSNIMFCYGQDWWNSLYRKDTK